MALEPLVDLAGVDARLGGVPILRDVHLRLAAGEVAGLVGPNGAGKSTLLRVVATLLRPHQGMGTVLGARLGSPAVMAVRPRIGLVGHQPALAPELTLQENLTFVAQLAGRPSDRAAEVLAQVGLAGAAHRRAGAASNGMQRRVDLARLLLTEPSLLLLDEPHAGLDRAAATVVEALVLGVRTRGGAAILVSHDDRDFAGLVDRRWSMTDGSVVALTESRA